MTHENHHHHNIPRQTGKAFTIGIVLNFSFVIIEAVAGVLQNSLALLTDAGHNLSDVAGLLLVIAAERLSRKKPTEKFTYGYGKSTILVALINGGLLLVAVGAIGWEAIGRINNVHFVNGEGISLVAFAGIIVNTTSALLFMRDRKKDLNVRGAFLHMAADALVSLGVLISGIIIVYTGWFQLDAIISLVIIAVILWSTWGLLRDSLYLSLDSVPDNIDISAVRNYLMGLKGVTGIHDLHIWALSTNAAALTAHLEAPEGISDSYRAEIINELHNKFNIDHTTIQVEKSADVNCEQEC